MGSNRAAHDKEAVVAYHAIPSVMLADFAMFVAAIVLYSASRTRLTRILTSFLLVYIIIEFALHWYMEEAVAVLLRQGY